MSPGSWEENSTLKFFITIVFAFSLFTLRAQVVNRTIKAGNDAYKKGDYKNAVSLYKTALEKDSKSIPAKFNLANALDKLSDPASAEKYYDDITSSTDPSLKAKAFYNKGVAEAQQQNLPEAIESFKRALLLTPEDNDTRENLQKAINDLKKQQQQNQPKAQKNKQKQQPQQKNKMPNPEMMEQKFNELRDKEKQLQKMLQQKSTQGQPDKDW
jgi:tetratricopeptide (TPR) repeat protein